MDSMCRRIRATPPLADVPILLTASMTVILL
jgi:hypothetical protein